MIRVYFADAIRTERQALRLVVLDMNMEIVGEADNWLTTLAEVPLRRTDMLVVDWEILPAAPNAALDELRSLCPQTLVIVLVSSLEARQQAALSGGADVFISKRELPDRVAERLKAAAAMIRS